MLINIKEKKKRIGRHSKRTIALMLSLVMFNNSGGSDLLFGFNKILSSITAHADDIQHTAELSEPVHTDGETYTITSAGELLWLANQDPSDYQNATITITGNNSDNSFGQVIQNFPGIGGNTAATAFKGTVRITDSSQLFLHSNHSLFNWISDKAQIIDASGSTASISVSRLAITDSDDLSSPLLAEHVVHDSSATASLFGNVHLIIEDNSYTAYQNNVSPYYGGIIGTIDDNADVYLNVTNDSEAAITNTSNAAIGFACGSLGQNAHLTFIFDNNSSHKDFSVSSENGNAGGIAGQLGQGSVLTVNNTFSYTADVTGGSNAGGLAGLMESSSHLTISTGAVSYSGNVSAQNNAGGLVGSMDSGAELNITGSYAFSGTVSAEAEDSCAGGLVGLSADEELEISGTTTVTGNINSQKYSGGLIGNVSYSADTTLDITNKHITVNDASLSGQNCGGLFGEFINTGDSPTKIELKNGSVDTKLSGAATNYGGLIGEYSSPLLGNELAINGLTVTTDINGETATSFGGLIGVIAENSKVGSYINITENVTAVTNNTDAGIENYGGIIGNAGESGNFVDINTTNLTVTASSGFNGNVKSGGLIGTMTNGILRLNGAINLNGAAPLSEGQGHGQIVGYRNNALVYADSSYSLTRCTGVNVDDIGQWGEVVRFAEIGGANTIVYSSGDHTVTLKKPALAVVDGTNTMTVADKYDFARLALYIQLNTNGNIGALGFEDADDLLSSDLLSYDISMSNNITVDLAKTGLTGLTRDDDSSTEFSGTFYGNNSTIKLAVGDTSKDSNNNALFNGKIYSHTHNALIAKASSATVNELTVDGTMNVYRVTGNQYAAGFIAEHTEGNLTFEKVTSSQTVNAVKEMRVGGILARSVKGNVYFAADITDDPCIVKCTINNTETPNAHIGGLLSETAGGSVYINNVLFQNAVIGAELNANSGKCGGFVGYELLNTAVYINKLNIGSASDTSASQLKLTNSSATPKLGGLIYKATGFVQVNDLNFNKASISSSVKPDSLGILVNDGKALYLEVTNDDYYKITDNNIQTLTVSVSGDPTVFDEFVAYTKDNGTDDDNGKGVVSIPTKDRNKITANSDGTVNNLYSNRIKLGTNSKANTKINSNTRYYYNIDKIKKSPSSTNMGEHLLLWSLHNYANSTAKNAMPATDSFTTHLDDEFKSNKIHGECDLTGLSYYPITFPNDVNIEGATITFDNKKLKFNNVNDAVVGTNSNAGDDTARNQHYRMQQALFIGMTKGQTLTIKGSNTLKGAIGNTGASGALFCGNILGEASGSTSNPATLICTDGSTITLKDLYVRGYNGTTDINSNIRPLLINSIGTYTNITLIGIHTDSDSETYDLPIIDEANQTRQEYAASSLIGNVGGKSAKEVNIIFKDIALDSRKTTSPTGFSANNITEFKNAYKTDKSIFYLATLMHSFSYADSASSGVYNFNKLEDWSGNTALHNVTYGYEIDNSDEHKDGTGSKEQRYLEPRDFVAALSPNSDYAFTKDYFRPYVFNTKLNNSNNDKNYHELKVNVLVIQFDGGCGTYGDPYRITTGEQFAELANMLNTKNFDPGYKLYYNMNEDSSPCGHGSDTHGEIWEYSGSVFTRDGDAAISKDKMYEHIRNAYYIITKDIELPLGYQGLGSSEQGGAYKIFRGVIVGQYNEDTSVNSNTENHYPTITVNDTKPLVNVSGGCVIKDLNVIFTKDITISSSEIDSQPVNKIRFLPDSDTGFKGCPYFGGVIGEVFVGDNIIDNVSVSFIKTVDNGDGTTTTTSPNIVVTGTKNYLIPIGAYAGVVRNGGLIFRNMSGKSGLGDNIVYNGTVADDNKIAMSDKKFIYVNPYVGRVLDGFVVTDDEGKFGDSDTVNNGDKSYSVVAITKPTSDSDKLFLSTWDNKPINYLPKETSHSSFTWANINLPNAQSLFVLSAMVASGAASYQTTDEKSPYANNDNSFNYYHETAYYIGNTRLAQYCDVGNTDGTGDYIIAKDDVFGKTDKNQKDKLISIPYLVKYYTLEQETKSNNGTIILDNYPARIICSTNTRFNITLTGSNTTYEMPKGFRGINAMFNNTSYSDNLDRQVINMFGFNGGGNTIKLSTKVMTYGANDPYNPYGIGIITRFQQNTKDQINSKVADWAKWDEGEPEWTVKEGNVDVTKTWSDSTEQGLNTKDLYSVRDLTISGSIAYEPAEGDNYETNEWVKEIYVGAFAGRNYESNGKTHHFIFENITLGTESDGLTVSGGYYSGGIIGTIYKYDEQYDKTYAPKGYFTNSAYVANVVFRNINSNNVSITARKWSGGIAGNIQKCTNTVVIDGVNDNNSFKIGSIASTNARTPGGDIISGGLIGSMTDNTPNGCCIKKMNVSGVDANSNVGDSNNKYSGGLIGRTKKAAAISDSTVSGLTISSSWNKSDEFSASGGFIGCSDNGGNPKIDCCEASSLKLEAASTSYEANSGAVCGKLLNNAEISNVKIDNCEIKAATAGVSNVGALVGGMNSSSSTVKGYNILWNGNSFSLDGASGTKYSGNWIGNSSNGLVQLLAVSKQGNADNMLENDIGNGTDSENYIVYADKEGVSLTTDANKPESAHSPYLTVNPASKNLPDFKEEKVTGDGVALKDGEPLAKHIITEATEQSSDNSKYADIADLADMFIFSGVTANVITFNQQLDNDGLTTQFDTAKDFPVLVIQSSDSAAITSLVNNYISVLSNEKNTNVSKFDVQTYKLEGSTLKPVDGLNSLRVINDNTLRSVPGQYDNEHAQFTMIKASFDSPVNADDKLDLYIPVIVKKVLQFRVDTRVLSGTTYLDTGYSAIPENAKIVENNGVPITSMITFTYYERTYQEWLDSILAGEDYYWNFDKCIMLRHNSDKTPLPVGTSITLIDRNNNDKAYYGKIGDVSGDKKLFEAENSGKLNFELLREFPDESKSFEAVTLAQLLCEQLNLTAYPDTTNGQLIKCSPNDTIAPTIIAYSDNVPTYFRVYNEETDSELDPQPTKYSLTIPGVSQNNYSAIKPEIKETYFITVQTEKSVTSVIYDEVCYPYTTLTGGKMATFKNAATINSFVLGNFFELTNFSIVTKSSEEIKMKMDSNIKTEMKVDLIFIPENKETFSSYSDDIDLNQGFLMSYVRYDRDEDGTYPKSPQSIINGTIVRGDYIVKSDNETVTGNFSKEVKDTCNEFLIECPQKDTDGNDIDLKRIIQDSQDGKLTLTADFRISFENFDESKFALQFPAHNNLVADDKSGLVVCGKSSLAYDADSIQSSIVSNGNAEEDGYGQTFDEAKRYYVTQTVAAKLTFDAIDEDIGDSFGKFSQLGINANELYDTNIVHINALGIFDASNLVDQENADTVELEFSLKPKLKTENKWDEDFNDDILKYLQNFKVEISGNEYTLNNSDEGLRITSSNNTLKITDHDWQGLSNGTGSIRIKTSFDVLTGNEFDMPKSDGTPALDLLFSNYFLELTVKLKNGTTQITNPPGRDHIIYTNCRIKTDIIQ